MDDEGWEEVKPKKTFKPKPQMQENFGQVGGKKGNKLVAGPIQQNNFGGGMMSAGSGS